MESRSKSVEMTKRDDRTAERAATLLESQDNQLKQADKAKKSHCGRIAFGVLLLCFLIVILAVVFAIKHRCSQEVTSCKNRCSSDDRNKSAVCHCDSSCLKEGDCCLDFQEVCVDPFKLWTCTKFRCGEERMANTKCSCSDDCTKHGDCCTDYVGTCKGEKIWVDEECENVESPQCPSSFSRPPVILVSMDGFRAGYLESYGGLLPVLSKLKKCGTSTPYMRPAYPTKTFPNHYTIVTGLYPESHGIVDNKMYDVTRNATFSLRNSEKFNPKWYLGQPVWLTAIYNKLKSGTFFWPGADVFINGSYPTLYKNFDMGVPFEKRVTTILEWLSLAPEQRPDFYTLYLDEPDTTGHHYGPASSQVIKALIKVDNVMGLLMNGLKQRSLHNCVNLVLLSDHGMEEASCKKADYVSKYQDNINDFTVIQGPAARIRPKKLPAEFFSFDYEGLVKNLSCRTSDGSMKPYLKEHLPKRLHFANNVRIERAHLYMKAQWQAALKPGDIKYCAGGFHGSDNVFKNMQTIFIAHGPGIQSQKTVPPFENIEVYNLICDLLGIPPAPNNGTHGSLNNILKRPFYSPVYPAELSPPSTCVTAGPPDDLGCTCGADSKARVDSLNQELLKSSSNHGVKALHLPYGIPRVVQNDAEYCPLYHSNYINGYSKDIFMPLWVAYTVKPLDFVPPLTPRMEDCVRADVRIPASKSQMCSRYKNNDSLSFGLLHPPNLDRKISDSMITSNMVPMFPAFKEFWAYFHEVILTKYSQDLNGVNVMSGPIFDQNFDGNFDKMKTVKPNEAPIPTHFFVILTSCKDSSFSPNDCVGPLDALSFILPHRPDNMETCADGTDFQWVQEWIEFHVARVRDVELLTGLSFYHDRISVTETLQLKTFLKTF